VCVCVCTAARSRGSLALATILCSLILAPFNGSPCEKSIYNGYTHTRTHHPTSSHSDSHLLEEKQVKPILKAVTLHSEVSLNMQPRKWQ